MSGNISKYNGGYVRVSCLASYLQVTDLPSNVGQTGGVVGHVGEDETLFIVVFAEDLVVAEVKPVADTEPAKTKRSKYIFT